MPNKLLGQNFLRNEEAVAKIIRALDVSPGDIIFEIGPGHGELTFPLLSRCSSVGVRLIVVEKDERLAAALSERASEVGLENLEVISGDILENLERLLSLYRSAGVSRYKIVGNIPYYITGQLLRLVGELGERPARCVFLIQREVADRIVAHPPDMNRLAASVQFWADPRVVVRISRKDFFPRPNVDSSVILLESRTALPFDPLRYYIAVRALFAQPRKTILNNLAAANKEMTKNDIVERLAGIHIAPDGRPQDLSTTEIVAIANSLF